LIELEQLCDSSLIDARSIEALNVIAWLTTIIIIVIIIIAIIIIIIIIKRRRGATTRGGGSWMIEI